MDKLSKTAKSLLAIVLASSLTLNIATLVLLKNQSNRIDLITSLTNEINNRGINILNNVNNVETKDIMAPTELAEYLDIDIKEIYKLIIDNPDSEFPYIKINGEVRFSKKAIDEYIINGNKTLN